MIERNSNNGDSVPGSLQMGSDHMDHIAMVPTSDWSDMTATEHFVQFYEMDDFLLNSLSGFVGTGLSAGETVIVIATQAHREGLEQLLQKHGLDLAGLKTSGQFVLLDAAETLEKLMVDGSADPTKFDNVIGSLVAGISQSRPGLRAFGEMVALLWAEGNHAAAVALEELWNELQKNHSFSLFCAYPMNALDGENFTEPLGGVCTSHSRVIPAESYSTLSSPDERLRAVLRLQQKARSLEGEIVERKRAQEALGQREAELTDFIENAALGMHWVGKDGLIKWANRSEMELLGYSREEYIGHHVAEFHADQEVIRDILEQLSRGEELHSHEARLKAKDGSIRHVLISSNVYWENGEFMHTRCFTRDITDRKRAEEASLHLAAIVTSSADGIISKNLNGEILSWNEGAERIFGYRAEEVIGKPVTILIPPERIDEEPAILDRLRRGELIDHYETVRVTKDGRPVNVSLTVSPIRDSSGKVIAASKIARDITERKRAEAELERLLAREQAARAEAESANRMKDEFLATVSHELRTPLTAIMGWSHMLRKGKLDEVTLARAVETIDRNAKAQAQLVEDILDVSRMIMGKLRLNVGPVDVAAVINAAIDSVQLAADSKGIKLEVTLDPSARRTVGDASRLQQVVWNLISNAIKFTPSGGRVAVRLERADPFVQIRVTDTGCGINPDFLPFVFDRFRQADGTPTRMHGGLGLGLAIAKHLVELHGGSVQADSAGDGQGATFTINLPQAADQKHGKSRSSVANSMRLAELVERQPDSLPSLENVQVLLVDDDPDTLQILSVLLGEQKAQVQEASSVAEAVEVLQWYEPDVLVSDLGMPNEDGYVLIEKLRAMDEKNGKQTPALALTSYVRVADRTRALAAGFNLFVPKPVEPNELISAIAHLSETAKSV
ncbi:MAG: PAS domain S-box protein [Pyrinomonadaceae bacterium]